MTLLINRYFLNTLTSDHRSVPAEVFAANRLRQSSVVGLNFVHSFRLWLIFR